MHNHPKQIGNFTGGQYSKGDLQNWALGKNKGTSVTIQYGSAKIKCALEKTNKFSANNFLKSVKSSNALLESSSNLKLDTANIGNFLKQNQKQIGYKHKVRIID